MYSIPQPTGPFIREVLPLCRDAVGVFYSPSQLGHSLEESNPSAEMQSMYSIAPTDWAIHWKSFTPLQRCSRCILQPQPTGPFISGVLPLYRYAGSVFYRPSHLDYFSAINFTNLKAIFFIKVFPTLLNVS